MLIFHEITDKVENTQLKELDEYKDRLLASVTHELRTPLNCIIPLMTMTQTLETIAPDVKRNFIQPTLSAAKFQIKQRKLRMNATRFELYPILEEILRLFELQAEMKSNRLNYKVDPLLPQTIYTDRNRFMQILINLVGNAMKFTKNGELACSVEDTGVGMPPEDLTKLFRMAGKFEEDHRKVNPSGLGLGLLISNALVMRLGGTQIRVESTLKKGSCFHFTIPSEYNTKEGESDENEVIPLENEKSIDPRVFFNSPQAKQTAQEEQEEEPCTCRRVLIVDDNDYNLFSLRQQLRRRMDQIEFAYNGKEAQRKVEELFQTLPSCESPRCRKIGVIFMDLDMPVMDGHDATAALRAKMKSKILPEIPIIMWSAQDDGKTLEKGYKSGVDEFMRKPVSPEELDKVLKKYIKSKRSQT
eukprot:TRINITY_DN7453_c0_g1_i3.p1 TRINITY_DN7453_c0_g1~~TRINITY_DN7453_c0_g1_i3.p1  ORF type:complete len:415 (-),score=98.87 TRINITY_DN7453_c0_g1_i3:63-1307(-)